MINLNIIVITYVNLNSQLKDYCWTYDINKDMLNFYTMRMNLEYLYKGFSFKIRCKYLKLENKFKHSFYN